MLIIRDDNQRTDYCFAYKYYLMLLINKLKKVYQSLMSGDSVMDRKSRFRGSVTFGKVCDYVSIEKIRDIYLFTLFELFRMATD